MHSDFFVLSTPVADGERFVILRRDTIPVYPLSWSSATWVEALDRWVRTAPLVSEEDLRAQLGEMGLTPEAIDERIRRARAMHTLNDLMPTTWERTTKIGYRNDHGQEVVQKTRWAGTVPDQQMYVLRCGDCGHEYGTNGSEIHNRRCPQCKGGSR